MEKGEEAVSNSAIEEEQQKQTSEDYGSPATAGNPAICLLQVSQNTNDPCSPALFDGSLNESVNDVYTPGDSIKLPQLESTRISNNCLGADFESDDISKTESGDSQYPMNAAFVQSARLEPPSKFLQSSSLNESESHPGMYYIFFKC